MAAVYVSNLVITSGSTFNQTFQLEATNAPLDLTGYGISSQMRKWAGSSSATDFTATITSPATSGTIELGLTSSQTADLKAGRQVYDVIISKGAIKETVVEGSVLVREGVTR
jgi:hypothetical protein